MNSEKSITSPKSQPPKKQSKQTFPEGGQGLNVLLTTKEALSNPTEPADPDGGGSLSPQHQKDLINKFFGDGNDQKLSGFEDGRKSRVEFQKLQIIDVANGVMALLGLSLAVVASDLEFEERDTDRLMYFLWLIFTSTFVAIFLIYLRNYQKVKFLKSRNVLPEKESMYSTGELSNFGIETFILLLQPYPFLQGIRVYMFNRYTQTEYYYYVNDFMTLLMPIRLYIFLRFILNSTIYRSPSAQRLSAMYGADNSYLYACKSLMKVAPFKSSMILLVGSIFVFGFMVRICERPLNRDAAVTMDYTTYGNAMWNVIVTMTTVGYGDFFARTEIGRFVIFIVCIWGVFVVSLMVVTMTNILTMSGGEERALTVLQRLELRKELRNEAAHILTNMARIGMNNRKIADRSIRKIENKKRITKIKTNLANFKKLERQIRSLDDSGNIGEEMTRQFEFLRDELKEMAERQGKIQGTVGQLCDMFGVKLKKAEPESSNKKSDHDTSADSQM